MIPLNSWTEGWAARGSELTAPPFISKKSFHGEDPHLGGGLSFLFFFNTPSPQYQVGERLILPPFQQALGPPFPTLSLGLSSVHVLKIYLFI